MMWSRARQAWFGSLACALLSACSTGSSTPAWCRSDDAGARVVVLPRKDAASLTLRELWSVGGAEGPHVFGLPIGPVVSAGGRVAVPDLQMHTVIVLDVDGTWVGPVVRQGQGPGEVEWPAAAQWADDDHLLIFDLARGSVLRTRVGGGEAPSRWTVAPKVIAAVSAAGQLPGVHLAGNGALILELLGTPVTGDPTHSRAAVVRLSPDGGVDTLEDQVTHVVGDGPYTHLVVPGSPRPVVAAATTGSIALAGSVAQYRIAVLNRSGDDSVLLCRPVPGLPYTDRERGEGFSGRREQILGRTLARLTLPAEPAAVGGIFFGAGGRLWVGRARPDPGTMRAEGGAWDIIAADGTLVGTVDAPARVVLFGEGGGHVYGLARGEHDEMSVVAYALTDVDASATSPPPGGGG
ncbi:MAG: hypothetical protein LJF06_11780 [Gemmatimonadetes bacterium]|nr:hypothetical protein [Gemmatimonadota bacterium]